MVYEALTVKVTCHRNFVILASWSRFSDPDAFNLPIKPSSAPTPASVPFAVAYGRACMVVVSG